MSSTTQVTDFTDLYTALQNKVRVTTGVTATENQAKQAINIGLQDMHIGFGEKFPWAERTEVLRTRPSYTTGSITTTIGSTTLTGASTLWNTNDDFGVANVIAGGKIAIGNNVYEVASVASDTSLTLTYAYVDASDTEVSYTYFEDELALHADFLRPLDLQRFSSPSDIFLISRNEFRRIYPRNFLVGRPVVATLIDLAPSGSAALRRRVRFHKPPDNTYLIPYSFVTNKLVSSSGGTLQTSFSADSDEPIVPLAYRHAILYHALYNWYRDKKDDVRSQEVKVEFEQLLSRIVGDQEIGAPRPQIQPRISPYVRKARRPWNRGAGSRFISGSAFDELRR